MPRKLRAARAKIAVKDDASGKLIVPFEANEGEMREAAEAVRRNPAEASTTVPKDNWRTCPNATGPKPGDFGDRG